MKVLFINSVCGIGSTGKICARLAEEFEAKGHEVKIAYGRDEYVPAEYRRFAVQIGTKTDVMLHGLQTRFFDTHGFGSKAATKAFLDWADQFDPDLVWLHNIHGYYIHVGLLFEWIKSRPQMQVKWTLHDCWAFTGHCSHFMAVGCEAWKEQCKHCSQKKEYPGSMLLDNSKQNYLRKKAAFTGVPNLSIIVPSKWLAGLVGQSFLKEYPVEVQYNTIDKNVFKPTPGNFRECNGLDGKFIILGVANVWTARKGLNDFLQLAQRLDDRYAIVLVGVSEAQMEELPANILGIERTHNAQELAEIYSAADVFLNPTYEDNYPTVNLEAEACGTPVITYDTGGCRETIVSPASKVIPCGDLDAVIGLLDELK